ncbi:celD [Scenedesmus sp. PABB004]|nr:celD [Scenedesmus sp. PABB004]
MATRPARPGPAGRSWRALAALLLAGAAVRRSSGAPVPAGVDLLPTGTAQLGAPLPAAPAAAAAAFPSVQAIPTARPAAGACAAVFGAGQQCGGNMTNPAGNCSAFASCNNTAWAGACCPAGTACSGIPTSGDTCWSCGGGLPPALAVASKTADDAAAPMCTRLAASGDFDYACVLGASLLFYDAQRSGRLPAGNRVPWRGDSALADKSPNGQSIAGGWYDAGDATRFTFPAAFTVSTLALGFLEFPEAFDGAGQTDHMLETLRWGADWLLKARYADGALVAVTWLPGAAPDVRASHLMWTRPEEMPGASAVRSLVAPQRGADLLAQAAAALAAVSVVFVERDPDYSRELLDAAEGLYRQAIDSEGLYSSSIPEVRGYYDSYSYIDDLAWAAAWLARRQPDTADALEEAKFYYDRHWMVEGGGEGRRFDYNNMVQPTGYLLSQLVPNGKSGYTQPIRDVMALWLGGQSNITYSPKGMAWIDSWGNLRYVANQALMGLLHNKAYPGGSRARAYTCFARKQARIMLGETGRSYVVGIGTNPPCRPHHRGASCVAPGPPGQPCDCTAYFNPGCNPNTIYGALVGGPTKDDAYEDLRWDFEKAEVALDWNAGFTGMLAGLADAGVSWDDCKAAGLEDGRGDAPPSLSGAGGGARRGGRGAAALAGAAAAWLALAALH